VGRKRSLLSGHRVVALDTCVLIYYFEENPEFHAPASEIINTVVAQGPEAAVSTMALLELQVGPYGKDAGDEADYYYDTLAVLPNFSWHPMTYEIADHAARLRAAHNLRVPDAVHLATALEAEATLFVTNDRALPDIEGIEYLVLKK